ncbi:MAG: hypothetical protein IIV99_06880 [Oscillospiraceae bacterium]|nr:hypothetical protein [Oscillospiraceae bacterium]
MIAQRTVPCATENPSVEKVIHINLDNETDIEIIRDYIYEQEKNKRTQQGTYVERVYDKEIVRQYTRRDYEDFYSFERGTERITRTEDTGYNKQHGQRGRDYT